MSAALQSPRHVSTPVKTFHEKENQPPIAAPPSTPLSLQSQARLLLQLDTEDMYSKVKRRSVLQPIVNRSKATPPERAQQSPLSELPVLPAVGDSRPRGSDGRDEKSEAESCSGREVLVTPTRRRARARKKKAASPEEVRRRPRTKRRYTKPRRKDRSASSSEEEVSEEAEECRPRWSERDRHREEGRARGRSSDTRRVSASTTAGRGRPRAAAAKEERPREAKARGRRRRSPSPPSQRNRPTAAADANDPIFTFSNAALPYLPVTLQPSSSSSSSSRPLPPSLPSSSSSPRPFTAAFHGALTSSSLSLRCYLLCSASSLIRRLRFILYRDGLSQKELSRCVGLSPATLSPLLNGAWPGLKLVYVSKLRAWAATQDVQAVMRVLQRMSAWGVDEAELMARCALSEAQLRRWLTFDTDLEERSAIDRSVEAFMRRSAPGTAASFTCTRPSIPAHTVPVSVL